MIKIVNYRTAEHLIEAQSAYTFEIDITQSGYTPIGIIQLQNSRGSIINTNGYWLDNNKTTLSVFNVNTVNTNWTTFMLCTIAYIKDEFI